MRSCWVLFALGALSFASSLRMIPLRNAIGASERKLSVGDIWELCDNSSYPIKPGKVVISPDPPKKGENVNVNAEFTSSTEVTSGNLNVVVRVGKIPLYSGVFDLCETLVNLKSGLECPLASGKALRAVVSENIPDFLPSGDYNGQVDVTDQDGKEVLCITFSVNL